MPKTRQPAVRKWRAMPRWAQLALAIGGVGISVYAGTIVAASCGGGRGINFPVFPIDLDGDREVSGAATNADIWVHITDYGTPPALALAGADGPVEVDVRRYSDDESDFGAWYSVSPANGLEADARYTLTAAFDEQETHTLEIATTDETLEPPQPTLGNIRYYVYSHPEDPVGDNNCAPTQWDQTYYVFVDDPGLDEPYRLGMELSFPEGERGDVAWRTDWNRIVTEEAQMSGSEPVVFGRSLGTTAIPCLRVTIEDVLGRTVSSEEICQPTGCIRDDEVDHTRELWRSSSWAGVTECEQALRETSDDVPNGESDSSDGASCQISAGRTSFGGAVALGLPLVALLIYRRRRR